MRYILLLLIRFYQYFVSPLLGSNCRFYPTCSAYAKEAIQKRGTIIGLYLATKRILKCNPFFHGGYDPVSQEKSTLCADKKGEQ